MPFAPIDLDAYVELHMQANPDEDPKDLRTRLKEALTARLAGQKCDCGNPIWVVGSASAGHACFTCITLEAAPDDDYEIAGACTDDEL
nr:putative integron gene cassette protein [uncultured bacterium]CAP47849.1 putative integron gene cassette protein [uncultured bacterium]